MSSGDSDDEPLSVLAAAKKSNPEQIVHQHKKKKRKPPKKTQVSPYKKLPLTFNFSRKLSNSNPPVVQRPADVWLYLKDFTPIGPYSCLLCNEWFINRAKIVVHYVLNHKRDYCGICRYFVPDREAWQAHLKFHTPWSCSQCRENFDTEIQLRLHLSKSHNLVHCRLCHFRLSDNDQYDSHLFQKHSVSNVASKDEELLWETEYEGSPQFFCLLCGKSNNPTPTFFNHFMGYHHFTLKCFTSIISGIDTQFTVIGADVSQEFIQSLSNQKLGYIDVGSKIEPENTETKTEEQKTILEEILLEVKQEISDTEEPKPKEQEEEIPTQEEALRNLSELVRSYRGVEDFDVTLMELIILQKCYFDYVNQIMNDINCNQMPENSDIDYEHAKSDIIMEVDCSLCQTKQHTVQTFTSHMNKCHSVKSVPIFSCRVCATTFDSQNELEHHISEELGDFEDLWICQFCDKEFDNRQTSRRHLTEHWDLLEYDNCFSPHLGFKCKYCPTLFWNETDRETHQVRVHMSRYKDHYYKCKTGNCSEVFSEKIWFIHHYLEKHHNDETTSLYLLKCCICCVVVASIEDMRAHFTSEHPEARKIFCSLDECKYRPLSHKKSFQLHLRSQHSAVGRSGRGAACGACGRSFPSARARSAHAAQAHGPARYACKLCVQTLHSMDERKLHYLIKHPGHHPYECNVCGKSFQYKSSLYMHKQDHAPNKQTYTCTYCQKVFNKKDSFREHLQIHEGPRHACSYCPMRFVQRSNMLRHERRHTGERPYACPHCDRTFSDKGACNSHVRTHTKGSSFACLYCGQSFAQKSKLTYHIRKHTGENLETCNVCSKIFTSACSLREHMKVHEPKKEIVSCPLCDRKYQDERYMLRHLRTSHSFVRYSCPLCDKTLTSAAGLRHHVVTHSPLNVFTCKCCSKSSAVKRTMVKHLRKRHNLKSGEVNIKEFYTKLDPSECQLGLDEQTMKTIFGPPRRKINDVLIGDFVTLKPTENDADKSISTENEDNDDNDSDGSDESKSDDDEEKEKSVKEEIEKEEERKESTKGSDGETVLEPTDFVTVKIEPMDEDAQNA